MFPRPCGWLGRATLAVVMALATAPVPTLAAQDAAERLAPAEFRGWATGFAGAYELDTGHHLVVVPHTDLRLLSIFELETGLVRPLTGDGPDSFTYGPNVVSATPIQGRVTFERGPDGEVGHLRWEHGGIGSTSIRARRIPLRREDVHFRSADRARLSGWLLTPPTDGPHPVAVVFQPGANDRFGMWRTAMALAVDGIGVLVFDRRNVGESTGTALPEHYWSATQELAKDGVAAVRFARSHPAVDPERVGVVGWSQGGWLGALVASRIPDLAFYVSIAGNANPGWQQNRWNKLSSLRWEGFGEADLAEADAFLERYFGVMHGETSWETYEGAVARLQGEAWFEWMEETFGLWSSEAEAREYAALERENVPERDFARVTAPSLGLFFEFDESSPPESPWIFLRGRSRSASPAVTVRVIPDATHGAFVVDSFPTEAGQSEITHLAPELFRTLRSWIAERVGAEPRRGGT